MGDLCFDDYLRRSKRRGFWAHQSKPVNTPELPSFSVYPGTTVVRKGHKRDSEVRAASSGIFSSAD